MIGKSRWGLLTGDDGHDTANSINVEYYLLWFLELFYLQLFISAESFIFYCEESFWFHLYLVSTSDLQVLNNK